jgi:broad specificity phosphatase PhoE
MSVEVPGGLASSLALAPRDAPFALLLRHADRAPIPAGEHGAEVGLTAIGEARAASLAKHHVFESRPITWCAASPLPRCLATARCAGQQATPETLLGEPGAFVTDGALAGEAFLRLGTEAIVRAHLAGHPWPFLRSPEEGARRVLGHIANALAARGGVGLLVSHDTIVMPVIAWATGERFEGTWLEPLDGVVAVRIDGGRVRVIWRGTAFEVSL